MTEAERGRVLVVDDEPDVLDLYEQFLSEAYAVETAASGQAALAAADEGVSVVVLDRRLPDVSGDEVLAALRERGLECRVAMVTAVDPDFDIIEMPFDDYLVKPVGGDQLRRTVEHLFDRIQYSELLAEHYRVASKVAALEAAKPAWELEDSDEFAELQDRAERLREQVTETLLEMDDYVSAFSELDVPDGTVQRE